MANDSLQGVDAVPHTHEASFRKAEYVIPSEDVVSRTIRRMTDIAASLCVLVFTGPLLLLVTLLVRLESPGPAIFLHQRVGQNRRRRRDVSYGGPERRVTPGYGRPFRLLKFRSMYSDARERFPDSYVYKHTREELHTLPMKVLLGPRSMMRSDPALGTDPDKPYARDPRLTRLGYFLRKTSVDELPNFWNVLKGEMSIVGPRPDVADQIPLYELHHLRKLDVKPGVTGLSQVMGRGLLTFVRTNELDLQYVENRSLLLDWKVVLKTILEAIKGAGT